MLTSTNGSRAGPLSGRFVVLSRSCLLHHTSWNDYDDHDNNGLCVQRHTGSNTKVPPADGPRIGLVSLRSRGFGHPQRSSVYNSGTGNARPSRYEFREIVLDQRSSKRVCELPM